MLYTPHQAPNWRVETYRSIRAIDGYLYLGMFTDALAELNTIASDDASLPEVLLSWNRVMINLKKWWVVVASTDVAYQQFTDWDEFLVQRAFALHIMHKGKEAIMVIEGAPERMRKTGILHYNLGCYEARFGDLEIARKCIKAAIQINKEMKKKAKIDPDLKSLFDH